jgi:hypothetical protein
MTRSDFLDKQFYVSFHAAMNQAYHQHNFTSFQRWDRGAKVATCAAATLGAVFSVVTSFDSQAIWIPYSVGFSLAAAVGTFGVLFAPFGDWTRWHADMSMKWSALRREVDALEFALEGEPNKKQTNQLGKLQSLMHSLCGEENPRPFRHVLRRCDSNERKKRGMKALSALPWRSAFWQAIASVLI